MNHPDIVCVKRGDAKYPRLLAHITDPPEELYCRGNLALLATPCLAVVGTRKITPYGKEAATCLVRDLAAGGFTIVSGLALGIDAAAHQAALDCGGPTIAVLGGGVDDATIGPRSNFRLAQDILTGGGLIVAEYPPGYPPAVHTFPMRNRIVSGLSHGVVVIEADKESGALITAQSALDQNRDVFAVPGGIFMPRSAGPNALIQKGAKLVLTAQDVIEEYAARQDVLPLSPAAVSTRSPAERAILAILDASGPSHMDAIIKESGRAAGEIIAAVSLMEINGLLRHVGNGVYARR